MAKWVNVESVLKQLKAELGKGGPLEFRSEEMLGCDATLLDVIEMLEEASAVSNDPLAWEDLKDLIGQPIYIIQLGHQLDVDPDQCKQTRTFRHDQRLLDELHVVDHRLD